MFADVTSRSVVLLQVVSVHHQLSSPATECRTLKDTQACRHCLCIFFMGAVVAHRWLCLILKPTDLFTTTSFWKFWNQKIFTSAHRKDQHKGYFGTEKRQRNENLREWRVHESALERPQQHGSNPCFRCTPPSPDTSCKSGNASHQDFYRENSERSQLSWSGQRVSPNWLLWWYDFADLISIRFIIQIPYMIFMFITSVQGLAWKKSALPACHPCAWGYGSECVRQVRIDCFMKVIHLVQLGKEVIRKIRMLGCARRSTQDDFLVRIWPLAILLSWLPSIAI